MADGQPKTNGSARISVDSFFQVEQPKRAEHAFTYGNTYISGNARAHLGDSYVYGHVYDDVRLIDNARAVVGNVYSDDSFRDFREPQSYNPKVQKIGREAQYNNTGAGRQENNSGDGNQVNVSGNGSSVFNFNDVAKTQRTILPANLVPFARDQHFVEREELLTVLEKAAQPAARVGLVGLGGVGKTQVAIEYAYQRRSREQDLWVFWVQANNAYYLQKSYEQIADALQLTRVTSSASDILATVYNWLCNEHNGKWTMIVDNADERDVLKTSSNDLKSVGISLAAYLPVSPKGSVIVTSRSVEAVSVLVDYADIVHLGAMSKFAAKALLRKRLGILSTDATDAELSALVHELNYMPLAISQAAAFIWQRHEHDPLATLQGYLEVLKSNDQACADLLQYSMHDVRRTLHDSNSILRTWYTSFDQMRRSYSSAGELLSLMSLCDRQSIPYDLLEEFYALKMEPTPIALPAFVSALSTFSMYLIRGIRMLLPFSLLWLTSLAGSRTSWCSTASAKTSRAAHRPRIEYQNGMRQAARSELPYKGNPIQDDIAILKAYQFIDSSQNGRTYTMHRLVQVSTRTWLEKRHELVRWQSDYLRSLRRKFPKDTSDTPSLWHVRLTLLPHVEALLDLTLDNKPLDELLASLMYDASRAALKLGRFQMAERMARNAAMIFRENGSMNNPEALLKESWLGEVLSRMGEHKDAEKIVRKILEQEQKPLGKSHINVLRDKLRLARILINSDSIADPKARIEVRRIYEDVLYPTETRRSEEQNEIWTEAMYGLVSFLMETGQLHEAGEALNRIPTPEAEGNRLRLKDLEADLLHRQGKYQEEYVLLSDVVDGSKTLFGPEHPETLNATGNLSVCQWYCGDEVTARTSLTDVIRGLTAFHGNDNHPDVKKWTKKMDELKLRHVIKGPVYVKGPVTRALIPSQVDDLQQF